MDVIMPQLGETVTEGTVANWYKKVGDAVRADEPLFEVETDKVTTEIPAIASGVLKAILVEPGTTVPVGTVLAVIETAPRNSRGEQK
jgi:pyruvate/2-oxoglutarate dehydrogenase complex dihydrolipoamide acyltransferase (E2) component